MLTGCKQVGKPAEEDLKRWGHHSSPSTVPDDIMAQADPDVISFVFSCQVCNPRLQTATCSNPWTSVQAALMQSR